MSEVFTTEDHAFKLPPPKFMSIAPGFEEHFFIGRLPKEGEAVEIICIGRHKSTGNLEFQLRVIEPVPWQCAPSTKEET